MYNRYVRSSNEVNSGFKYYDKNTYIELEHEIDDQSLRVIAENRFEHEIDDHSLRAERSSERTELNA